MERPAARLGLLSMQRALVSTLSITWNFSIFIFRPLAWIYCHYCTQLWLMIEKGIARHARYSRYTCTVVPAAVALHLWDYSWMKWQPFLSRPETTHKAEHHKCHRHHCFWGISCQALERQRLWPQYERRYTSATCKLQDSLKADHVCYRLPSSHCQSMLNHFHRNLSACHFLSYFFSLSTQFLRWLFEDLSSTFLLSYKANPGRGWCEETRQSRAVKNINTIFFLLSRGKGGRRGLGGGVCKRDEDLITAQQLCNSPPW